MIAKDGEKVSLHHQFTMEGEVKNYLNRLTAVMQHSLKIILLYQMLYNPVRIVLPRHAWLVPLFECSHLEVSFQY